MSAIQLRIVIKQMLLPPGIALWLIVAGLLTGSSGEVLSWLGVFLLYCFSISPTANFLLKKLEYYPAQDMERLCLDAGAIVVIGGGLPRQAPELSGLQPAEYTLERARYGALLHKKTGLPVLVSGGGPKSDAQAMANYLRMDYNIDSLLIENQSLTTLQNAIFSKQLLEKENISRIFLVTHAWHMPRAVWSFKQSGLDVIPAPTAFAGSEVSWGRLTHWVPRAVYLRWCVVALNELVGQVWYQYISRRA